MALQQDYDLNGVAVPNAYRRIDRVVVEHKQSLYCVLRTYANPTQAASRNFLPKEDSYSFPWPVDAKGNPMAVADPAAYCYAQLMKLPEIAGATAV